MDLVKKLEALAERGIDGEKSVAQMKLAGLKARYDFGMPVLNDPADLFSGHFQRSSKARSIYTFARQDFDVANSVKWAIESATKIRCVFRDRKLMAQARPHTAKKLGEIAAHIAESYQALIHKFRLLKGTSMEDRNVFVMGLYDGMMNEMRNAGQKLPGRPLSKHKTKKSKETECGTELHTHPYTLGHGLGKKIRFRTSMQEIVGELETATQAVAT